MSTSDLKGLSQVEAKRRLQETGANELPRTRARSLPRIVIDTMREPMFILLVGAATLYLVLGDFAEGIFLLGGAAASIGLVIFQEARSERALAALRELAQPQVRVIRDDQEHRIAARELVPGDLLLIGEGERIPADALLIGGDVLRVDESTLTGESAPVSKNPASPGADFTPEPHAGTESSSIVFAGTLSVAGQGVLRVMHTGVNSALGRIALALASIESEQTPLQQTAGRLVAKLGLLAIVFCVLVVITYGFLRDDWIAGILAGITMAIALIPEEFPMVLAIFMALGAFRLAARGVLVRRSAIIEALGGATVLCVDKTGTLTENRMQVASLWIAAQNRMFDCMDPSVQDAATAQHILRYAALASAQRPVDPMDKAIHARISADPAAGLVLERAWPLRPAMLAVIQAWRDPAQRMVVAAKGAPESIFRLCRLAPPEIENLQRILDTMGDAGLRVLGVASCDQQGVFPDEPETATFRFEGLLGFYDPVRTEVPVAIAEATAAGIKVIMITGDHGATAMAIANDAGIDTDAGCLLGAQLADMTSEQLAEQLRKVRVFARIAPEQKLMIVDALRANGEVVAMTGDGVNDAPALEAAHIGIAMGKRGTDVAREAADLVLLDDSFASIVSGVRLGRRIFANLRRALVYVTAIHLPIAGLALLPILLGLPQLLYPMHVVLLELAIDPICALVFEGEPSETTAMQRPPRRRDESLFGKRQMMFACIQGTGILIGVMGLYMFALREYPEDSARGAAFIALTGGNLLLALSDAMSTDAKLFGPHRRVFWLITGLLALVMVAIFSLPALADIFRVAPPGAPLLAIAAGVAAVSALWQPIGARFIRGRPGLGGNVEAGTS